MTQKPGRAVRERPRTPPKPVRVMRGSSGAFRKGKGALRETERGDQLEVAPAHRASAMLRPPWTTA